MTHTHVTAARAARGRLVAVLVLSVVALAVEVIGAVVANSLSLLADAGHLLTDVVGIGLALLAIWFAGRPPTLGRTFGYLRLEIIAAVANAILLFGVAGYVVFEAVRRLADPPEIAAGVMFAVALVGRQRTVFRYSCCATRSAPASTCAARISRCSATWVGRPP